MSEVLHELAGTPTAEAYCRLAAHVEASLRVFDEERARRQHGPRNVPSRN